MKSQFPRLHVGALTALTVFSFAAARADEPKAETKADVKPIKLAYIRKEGDTARYKSTLIYSVGGMEVPSEMTVKVVTKEVKPTGETTVIATSEGGKYTLNGTENQIPASAPITYTYNKSGRFASFKPEEEKNGLFSLPVQHLIALAHHIPLSDKPVKPGDTWKTELDSPAAKDKKITVTDTFVAIDKTEGVAAWKVKQTMDAEADTGEKISFVITSWLDPANGQLLKSEETIKGAPSMYGAMDWEGKTVRLKPEADKKDAEKKDPAKP